MIQRSSVVLLLVGLTAGAILAVAFYPHKIEIKKEIEYKDKIVEKEVEKWRTKIVEKEVVKFEKIKSTKTKITYPDGKIIETEVYESETEQLARLKSLEEEKYNELLKQKEVEYKEKYSKVVINPKKLGVYGITVSNPNKLDFYYGGGIMYDIGNILGIPISVGGQYTNNNSFGATIGVKF